MERKRQIHWSHVGAYLRCPEQYRRIYIEGERRPPGVALIVGSGTHESIEGNMLSKKDKGVLLPDDTVADLARDSVNRRWGEKGVELNDDEKAQGEANVKGEAVDMAVSLSLVHHKELAPEIEPAYVERPWVLELPGHPFYLAGRIDLQEKAQKGKKVGRLRDTKTSKRSPTKTQTDDADQYTMYALAAKVLDGAIPELCVDYLVKTKTPKAVTQHSTRDEADLQVLLRRVQVIAEAIETGVFVPCDRSSWVCNPKWCGFFDSCPYAKGRVSV